MTSHENRPITTGPHRTSEERPLAPGSWLPFPDSFEQRSAIPERGESTDVPAHSDSSINGGDDAQDLDYFEKLRSIHQFGDGDDPDGPLQDSSSARKPEPPILDQEVKELLANGEADRLLNVYRSMCITFPFVPTNDYTSAAQLHAMKPMLFLAIITVASWEDHKLQRHLDRVYRKQLAHYTYVRPKRTIALIQSLLVYLSRYLSIHANCGS